jgi:hypothetical protein
MIESVQWSGSSGGDDTPTGLCPSPSKVSQARQATAHGKMQGMVTKIWDLTKVVK